MGQALLLEEDANIGKRRDTSQRVAHRHNIERRLAIAEYHLLEAAAKARSLRIGLEAMQMRL